jgi:type II secretory pathway pseudopilin PulG
MTTLRRRVARDDGESLIELTVAIMILGVVVVAIGACIAFTVKASGVHRNQALADQYLHNYAEQLQSDYKPCTGNPGTTATSYINDLVTSPIGTPSSFASPTASIAFWNSTSAKFATSATCPANDPLLQQLTLNLTSTDGHVNESLVVVVRNSS